MFVNGIIYERYFAYMSLLELFRISNNFRKIFAFILSLKLKKKFGTFKNFFNILKEF